LFKTSSSSAIDYGENVFATGSRYEVGSATYTTIGSWNNPVAPNPSNDDIEVSGLSIDTAVATAGYPSITNKMQWEAAAILNIVPSIVGVLDDITGATRPSGNQTAGAYQIN